MGNGAVTYNNGKIHYEITGSGEPIVFVHGAALNRTMWERQVSYFSKNYKVITYDARGFGESDVPNGPYNHAADLHALLAHLNVRQAHIVGLSMGGRIATNFALQYPGAVKSLALLDSALDGYANEVDWNVDAKERGLKKAREKRLNHEVFAAARKQPRVAAALRLMLESYSGWHWLHDDLQSPANTGARNRLHKIAAPTLVIVGKHDLQYFHDVANVLAAGIAGAQKVVVPRAGHMVNMEAPDAVNKLLADFIARSRS